MPFLTQGKTNWKYISIVVILAILVGGGILLWQYFEEPTVEVEISEERTFPYGLVVANRNGLVNLRYNPSKQAYEKQAELTLPEINDVVLLDDYIFVSTEDEILKLTTKLEKSISKKFKTIGALATDDKNIFISAEESFIALDEALNELSRVKLLEEGWKKNAHDILIYKNTAYLLDNIETPLFLFRVNIKNPKNLQITEKIEFYGINAHLDKQWLNPELNQWLVIQSYGHRGGSGKIVHIYPMDKGKEPLGVQEILTYSRMPEEKEEGIDIKGITDLPPIWAITQDKEEKKDIGEKKKFYLTQINSEDNKISFSTSLTLDDFNIYTKALIKQKNNYLFVAPESGDILKIIDIEQQPKIVLSENLSDFNVRVIIDILPY